ncbi:MAG: SurA N-terminal domain-containing protein [Pseudomonadota bacterium]
MIRATAHAVKRTPLASLSIALGSAAVTAVTVIGGATSASAQGVPGIVISVPPSPAPTPQAQPRTARPTPPQTRQRAKPKKRTRRASTSRRAPKPRQPLKIEMLVNDIPITNYEISERAKLMALSGAIGKRAQQNFKALVQSKRTNNRLRAIFEEVVNANRGQPRQVIIAKFNRRKQAYARSLQRRAVQSARSSLVSGMKRKAREELIDERLKVAEAKRLGVTISRDQVDRVFAQVAQNNKKTPKQFARDLARGGASAGTMKARLEAQLAWNSVLARRFRRLVSVSQRDIDSFIGNQEDATGVRLRVQRISLPVTNIEDGSAVARRLADAQRIKQQTRGCAGSGNANLVRRTAGASIRDISSLDPNTIAEPTRSMLLSADPNEALAPSIGGDGVELYIVCGRTTAGSSFEQRDKALRQIEDRELRILGRRHLADLRRDAHIERR